MSFSLDGSRIVSVSARVKIWDATPINRKFLAREPAPAAGEAK
ncbi:MAG: hypothetical protein ACLQGP_35685 [Isosphaeraceae bacterium]